MHIQQLIKKGLRRLMNWAIATLPRVIHEVIETLSAEMFSECILQPIHKTIKAGYRTRIELQGCRLSAGSLDLVYYMTRIGCPVVVRDNDIQPLAGEPQCHVLAQSTAPAGDQGYFVFCFHRPYFSAKLDCKGRTVVAAIKVLFAKIK